MAIPIRNHVLEVIKQKENYTDKELEKALTKDGTIITEGKFNKVLLDLEIMGLINVAWVTKDNRRIQAVTEKVEEDAYDEQIKETQEKATCIDEFLKSKGNFSTIRKIFAPIWIKGPIKKFVENETLIVGDAAGQAKPTTAGGLDVFLNPPSSDSS